MLDQNPACQTLSYQSASEAQPNRQSALVASVQNHDRFGKMMGTVNLQRRVMRNGHASLIVALTGQSAEAINAIGIELERTLFNRGKQVYFLPFEHVQKRLHDQMLPAPADELAEKAELTRRYAQMAYILAESGQMVITSSFSQYQADREMAYRILAPHHFLEVFVNSETSSCGMVRAGANILPCNALSLSRQHITRRAYEPPEQPAIELDARRESVAESVVKILWGLAKITNHR